MVIGHYGVGLAAKKFAPNASLAVLIGSAIFLDILWITFLAFGWEKVHVLADNRLLIPIEFASFPYSHSLLTATGWAILFSLIYKKIAKYSTGSIVIGICVLSHWILDLIVHNPDLPIYPGSGRFLGLSLWKFQAISVILEGSLFIFGLWIYYRETRSVDRAGIYGFWAFILLLSGLFLGKLTGLPIENHFALFIFGVVTWISVPWAWWVERHRTTR